MIDPTFPKVLVLSYSGLGSLNATGQLIDSLFRGWPKQQIMQVYWGLHPVSKVLRIDAANNSSRKIFQDIEKFAPEVIYIRPADNHLEYSRITQRIVDHFNVPLVNHVMDDWPARVGHQDPGPELIEMLAGFIAKAHTNIAICQEMAEEYSRRYNSPFATVANGVDRHVWKQVGLSPRSGTFCLRYSGALADDMQYQSIADVGSAVAELAASGFDLRFEIYTMAWFQEAAQRIAASSPAISVHKLVKHEDYPKLLAGADGLVLAYNFDEHSFAYTKLSFANKTPECLASGSPVLAYGPLEIPTINHIVKNEVGFPVTKRDIGQLADTIGGIVNNREDAQKVGCWAQQHTFEHFNNTLIRGKLRSILVQAANSVMTSTSYARGDDVSVDETKVVHSYFRNYMPQLTGVMVDVGAHHGAAFKPFLDDGWTVHAFEPDPANRSYIQERFGGEESLVLNSFAVGDQSGQKLSFYASEQSTGISSLIPFHEGHKEVAVVETIRLDEYLEDKGLTDVDFLKIDTEGFDLNVLKGFRWSRRGPLVVECEFEDAKTTKIGYNLHDLAQFLIEQGYTVFVSEWHPIVRYGIRHQWRRLSNYPASDISETAWGNFLAFKQPISIAELNRLFENEMSVAPTKKTKSSISRSVTQATQSSAVSSRANGAETVTANGAGVAKANGPTKTKRQHTGSTMGPVRNHFRIFSSFLSSTTGAICGILLGLVIAPPMVLITLANLIQPTWVPLAAIGVSWIALVHTLAYLLERARFEAGSGGPLEGDVNYLRKRVGKLEADLNNRINQQDIEKSLAEIRKQNLDIKRKLPEIVEMISSAKFDDSNQ